MVSAGDDRGDLAAHAVADQHARSGLRDDRPHRIDYPCDVARSRVDGSAEAGQVDRDRRYATQPRAHRVPCRCTHPERVDEDQDRNGRDRSPAANGMGR
ncbi:hypothetical protein ASE67_09490 [Sphingomonas sp. Leaf23]|nr:hypothetical protein ASE67_09490 [Sphingomonas sp. Leaf23]